MVGEPQPFQPQVLHLAREVRKEMLTTHMFSLCKFFFYCLFSSDRRMPDPGESSASLPPCPSMPGTQAGRARSRAWHSGPYMCPCFFQARHLCHKFLICPSLSCSAITPRAPEKACPWAGGVGRGCVCVPVGPTHPPAGKRLLTQAPAWSPRRC